MDVSIRFLPSGRSIRVPEGTTLFEAGRRAGLPIAGACSADALCGRCGVRLLHGAGDVPEETTEERELKRRNRIDPELRLACRIAPTGDVEVTTPYW